MLNRTALQKSFLRVLSLGLPFYASMQLGGVRSALVLLLAISTKSTEWLSLGQDQSYLKQFLSGVTTWKFSIIWLLAVIGFDVLGVSTKGLPHGNALSGCIALAASILVLPLPLPGAKRIAGFSATSNQRLAMPASPTPPTTPRSIGPAMVSQLLSSVEEANTTLLAGIISSTFTLLAFAFTHSALHLPLSSYVFLLLACASAAGLFLFSQPLLLNTHGKFGVLAGCAMTAMFGGLCHSDSFSIPIIYSVWSAFAYVAILLDGLTASKLLQLNGSNNNNAADPHKHSPVTKFLLSLVTPGSVAHDILSDKDSRRIAYFAL